MSCPRRFSSRTFRRLKGNRNASVGRRLRTGGAYPSGSSPTDAFQGLRDRLGDLRAAVLRVVLGAVAVVLEVGVDELGLEDAGPCRSLAQDGGLEQVEAPADWRGEIAGAEQIAVPVRGLRPGRETTPTGP